jgi:iron complex outermembrane receptor protein
MAIARKVTLPCLLTALWAGQLTAQSGSISGRVTDVVTMDAIAGARVQLEGTRRETSTGPQGDFVLGDVPVGIHRVTARLIGYAPVTQEVTVSAGQTVAVELSLQRQAVVMDEIVVTGYGAQRRSAITGSVASVNAEEANVGVITNANELIQGRVAGVYISQNHGEPGAGQQIRIRGGTSISASNEPLYVIDGVAIQNLATEAQGIGIGGDPSLPRNPLNLLNPNDVESITVLKDAAAAAIYGARAANGVILIETKQGQRDRLTFEYDGYVSAAAPARRLDLLNGSEYRQFIQEQVEAGNLGPERLTTLGTANTDWEREVTRSAVTHNHNISFSGGTQSTEYRASLNYMNQEGVALSSGLERIQGRLNGTHYAWNDRLQLRVNLTASHVRNDYLPFEDEGGFEGGVFQNMAVFNPTQPVTVTDPATNQDVFYEIGTGRQSVRNPVAIAEQVQDFANTTRTLGNVRAQLDILSSLRGQLIVGVDRSESTRRQYFPRSSPVGAEWNGRALQISRDLTAVTLQGLFTFTENFGGVHDLEVVGGYEFNDYEQSEFRAEARDFLTDAFSFENLGAGAQLVTPGSYKEDSRLIGLFSRATYGFNDRYFLTGVFRYDGSSRFGANNKWAVFPAVSASWRISEESFMRDGPFSELRLRAGYGRQGNEAVPAYASLILLQPSDGASYPFGETKVVGVAPSRNPNPDLKWEKTDQFNVAVDYGFVNNRISGSLEYYVKITDDLLLEVPVPQPAVVATRLENIGKVSNRGLEATFDALVINRPNLTWQAGLVFAAERNRVDSLGGRCFITTGYVSGQGQSGQVSQRILPGFALGTFYGPEFVGVNPAGQQLFNQYTVQRDANGCVTGRTLVGQTTSPGGDDFVPIGEANPDFTVSLRSQLSWGRLDASLIVRAEQGRDVFNNTALVYSTKGNALQDKNFLREALTDPTGITQPAIFSSRWIEDGSFIRLQNVTVGYTLDLPALLGTARTARVYVSGDNLLLLTGYSGYDPEAHSDVGLASRGVDYLSYPRARTFTAGVRFSF